jgi:uncharacterized protein YjbI with pentapeptide repeats
MTTLPIEPDLFWGMIWTTGLLLALLLVFGALPRDTHHIAPLERFQARLNLEQINPGLFLVGLLMWALIFGLLFAGLLGLIWEMLWISQPIEQPDHSKASEEKPTFSDWRFTLAKLTATTAVLAAVVAFPVTLIRLGLTRKQTDTAQEALFNDKINAASEDLYAMRQRWDGEQNIWEDDIVRRHAAIDRLHGLSIERPDIAPRIARLLSSYVRQISKEYPADQVPPGLSTEELREWVRKLKVQRTDAEKAVQVLGQLRKISGVELSQIEINLQNTNLQKFNLIASDFQNANFFEAHVQGAAMDVANLRSAVLADLKAQGLSLNHAELQRADLSVSKMTAATLANAKLQNGRLSGAHLQEANLMMAEMEHSDLQWTNLKQAILVQTKLQCANLAYARLQGATLEQSHLNGAYLLNPKLDEETRVAEANFLGAALKDVNLAELIIMQTQIDKCFYDGSVIFPTGLEKNPDWDETVDLPKFDQRWAEWQKSIGFDPEDPSTWDGPSD